MFYFGLATDEVRGYKNTRMNICGLILNTRTYMFICKCSVIYTLQEKFAFDFFYFFKVFQTLLVLIYLQTNQKLERLLGRNRYMEIFVDNYSNQHPKSSNVITQKKQLPKFQTIKGIYHYNILYSFNQQNLYPIIMTFNEIDAEVGKDLRVSIVEVRGKTRKLSKRQSFTILNIIIGKT